jgi:hypothetical protein
MLFIVGALASIGTYGGIGTIYAAILNLFAWMLIGMGVASTTVALGDGSTMVVGANAVGLSYFAYLNAVGGLVPWFVTIYEEFQREEAPLEQANSNELEELMYGE